MIYPTIWLVSFACVNALERPFQPIQPKLINPTGKTEWQMTHPTKPPVKPETVVENKNVNIVVNVDPKDVAKELWSLIQMRLDGRDGRRSATNHHTVEELERIVSPVIAPTRRSHSPTAFELAYALDHATRKALLSGNLKRPTFDDEIDTREIVANMLIKLKRIMEKQNSANKNEEEMSFRRMINHDNDSRDSDDNESDDDEYVNVVVKMRRSEFLRENDIYPNDEP